MSCKIVAQGEALDYLLHCSAADRRAVADALGRLAAQPFQEGKPQRRDEAGRVLQILSAGGFVVTFWNDDSVRELRVVDLRKIPRRPRGR